MARKLSEIDLEEVSLVDKAAVNRKFLIIKKQEVDMDKDLTLEDVENKEEVEKTGRKLSKATIEKIQSVIKELSSLIEEAEEIIAVEVKKSEPDLTEILSYVKTKTKELVK